MEGIGMKATAFIVATVAALSIATTAAGQFNPLSWVKGAVEAVVEDRSSGDIAKDTEIKAKIVAAVLDEMSSDVIAINTDVYEQDVLLTGSVETAKQKNQAGTLAGASRGEEGRTASPRCVAENSPR